MRTRRSFGATRRSTPLFFVFAELPAAEKLVGVGLDLLAVERGNGGNDELDAELGFEIGEFRLDGIARFGGDDIRLIDDAARERRKINGEDGEARAQQRDESNRQVRTSPHEGGRGAAC